LILSWTEEVSFYILDFGLKSQKKRTTSRILDLENFDILNGLNTHIKNLHFAFHYFNILGILYFLFHEKQNTPVIRMVPLDHVIAMMLS